MNSNSEEAHGLWPVSMGNDAPTSQPQAAPVPAAAIAGLRSFSPRKNILLVDVNPRTRDSRAKILRSLGVDVRGVATASAARSQLAAAVYNMVLLDLGRDLEGARLLAQEIRAHNPRQLVAFLVGSPLFIAKSLSDKNTWPTQALSLQKAIVPAVTADDFGQRIRAAEEEKTA